MVLYKTRFVKLPYEIFKKRTATLNVAVRFYMDLGVYPLFRNTAFFFLPTMINKVSAPQLTIAADSHNARLFVLPVFGMFTFVTLLLVATIPYWLK